MGGVKCQREAGEGAGSPDAPVLRASNCPPIPKADEALNLFIRATVVTGMLYSRLSGQASYYIHHLTMSHKRSVRWAPLIIPIIVPKVLKSKRKAFTGKRWGQDLNPALSDT